MSGSPDPYADRDFLVGRAKGSPDAAPTPVKAPGADTPPKIKVGAKVTVTGTVRAWSDDPLAFGSSGGAAFEFDRASVSVEVLTPPAPTWQEGDVIRVGDLTRVLRDDPRRGLYWFSASGIAQAEANWYDKKGRPYTPIIRGGELVQP